MTITTLCFVVIDLNYNFIDMNTLQSYKNRATMERRITEDLTKWYNNLDESHKEDMTLNEFIKTTYRDLVNNDYANSPLDGGNDNSYFMLSESELI